MLTNLPTDFVDNMTSNSRKPVQLLHFVLGDVTYYISDAVVGISDGLEQDYNPWMESWGTLKDNTFINTLYQGNSLEARSGSIVLIISPASRPFVKQLFQAGIENTKVELYQWFKDMTSPPQLIDIMVCQDPINYSESSMLLSIDVVSVIMEANPYLWPEVPGQDQYPVVIGKALKMPLIDLQTARVTALSEALEFDYTGQIYIDNGVGFAASGEVVIDSEYISYDWITASTMNITARGLYGTVARPHISGALISPKGAVYDYAIASGPVNEVTNLQADGEPYVNEVTFFPGQNPVIARFIERKPWLKITPGNTGDPIIPDPQYSDEYGNATEKLEQNQVSATHYITSPAAINNSDISNAATLYQRYDTADLGPTGVWVNCDTVWGQDGSSSGLTNTNPEDVQWAAFPSPNYAQLSAYCGVLGCVYNTAQSEVRFFVGPDMSHLGTLISFSVYLEFGPADYALASKINYFYGTATIDGGGQLEDWGLVQNFSGTTKDYIPLNGQEIHIGTIETPHWNRVNDNGAFIRLQVFERQTYEQFPLNSNRALFSARAKMYIEYEPAAGGAGTPSQELLAHFNRDLSGYGQLLGVTAKLYYSITLDNAEVEVDIIRRNTADWNDNTSLQTNIYTANAAGQEYSVELNITDWAELQNTRVGIKQIFSDETSGVLQSNIQLSYVKFTLYVQPDSIDTPDEARVVYATDIYCDVESTLGADPTPPQVVQYLLEDHSTSGLYVDIPDFDSAHQEYDAVGYYLNGALDAGIRLHEALRQVLMEGMLRFLFNQGKIKVISYFEEKDSRVDTAITTDNILLRSRRIDNQPTDSIRNDITVSYNKDYYEGKFQDDVNVVDELSIAKFTRKEDRRELALINSAYVANLFAERLLFLTNGPTSVYSFEAFMPVYDLEKGDRVNTQTFLDPRFSSAGNVLSIERVFGQGKTQKINLFKISISNPTSEAYLDLLDKIEVNDANLYQELGFGIHTEIIIDDSQLDALLDFSLTEYLYIKETLTLETGTPAEGAGYGDSPYGDAGYGD